MIAKAVVLPHDDGLDMDVLLIICPIKNEST